MITLLLVYHRQDTINELFLIVRIFNIRMAPLNKYLDLIEVVILGEHQLLMCPFLEVLLEEELHEVVVEGANLPSLPPLLVLLLGGQLPLVFLYGLLRLLSFEHNLIPPMHQELLPGLRGIKWTALE